MLLKIAFVIAVCVAFSTLIANKATAQDASACSQKTFWIQSTASAVTIPQLEPSLERHSVPNLELVLPLDCQGQVIYPRNKSDYIPYVRQALTPMTAQRLLNYYGVLPDDPNVIRPSHGIMIAYQNFIYSVGLSSGLTDSELECVGTSQLPLAGLIIQTSVGALFDNEDIYDLTQSDVAYGLSQSLINNCLELNQGEGSF